MMLRRETMYMHLDLAGVLDVYMVDGWARLVFYKYTYIII